MSNTHQVADTGVMATETDACWVGIGNKDDMDSSAAQKLLGTETNEFDASFRHHSPP